MNSMLSNAPRKLAVCAGLLAALAPLPALAASSDPDEVEDYAKEEVVYVKADASGGTQGVYVVSEVEAAEDGTVTETADYQRVENLTDSRPLTSKRGEVSFGVTEGETFYYRGDLPATTELPWDVEAAYYLDGEAVDPEELAGAEGRATLAISLKPSKDAADSARLATFADNYLLQVSCTLDGDTADNIDAPDATAAKVGSDTQLTFMVMPGQAATLVVEADVEDFAFDGWQVAAVPLALSIDVDAREAMGDNADIDELTGAIADVNSGASELADGASDVDDGAAEVRDGASELAGGVDTLASSSADLTSGSASVAQGISDAKDGAGELSSAVSDSLVSGAETLADGSATYSASLSSQASDARTAAGSVDVAAAQGAYEAALQAYIGAYVQCTLYGGDPTTDEATVAAQGAMQQALTDFVTAQATVSGYQSAADALDGAASGYADLDAGIQGLVDTESQGSVYALRDAAQELADGLSTLDASYGDLDQGIADYTAGVADLQEGAQTLSDGAASLAQGTSELSSGAGELADGTQELADQTADLDGKIADAVSDRLDSYLNPEFTMVDFVNGGTDNIANVQFVIMTEAIEAPEEDEAAQQGDSAASSDAEQEEQSFFEKLKALF